MIEAARLEKHVCAGEERGPLHAWLEKQGIGVSPFMKVTAKGERYSSMWLLGEKYTCVVGEEGPWCWRTQCCL